MNLNKQLTAALGAAALLGSLSVQAQGFGAGYGPPEKRDPARVRRDVEQGYLSPETARRVYGDRFRDLPEDDRLAP